MIRVFFSCVALISLLIFSGPSWAACLAFPSGVGGDMTYNSDHQVFQYCNGTDWIAMNQPGSGMGGCLNPTATTGNIIFNKDYRVLQGCAGSVWRAMGPLNRAAPTVVTQGLIGYWPFDEVSGTIAADLSGNGLNGTLVNGPVWQPTGGIQGGALSFDGVNDRVSVADPGAGSALDFPTGTSITITAWIKTTNAAGCCQTILAKGPISSANYYFSVEDWGGGPTMDFGFANSVYREIYGGPNLIQNNVWKFVAVTYSFGTGPGAIYVNGVSSGPSLFNNPYPNAPSVNNQPLAFGSNGAGGDWFGGLMDNLRIYNRVLSPTEVSEIYTYELGGGGCAAPSGAAGDLLYNSAAARMQYCEGTQWISIGIKP
jgi:hypothetical protein